MAPDKKKFATDFWKRGAEAVAKENWDYAIECFSKSVEFAPDNLTYRQLLRSAVRKKYKDNKTGAKMASVKLMGIRGKIKKSKMQKDWENVDKLAEEGLKVNPWDASLSASVAEACLELEYGGEIAVFCYQCSLEMDPDNIEYCRALARLMEERGEFNGAIKLWEKVRKMEPDDTEARSKITQIGARAMMRKGGFDDAESSRDIKKDQTAYDADRSKRVQKGPAVEGPGDSPEADLERAIRKNPAEVGNYVKLAELYRNEKRLDEAVGMFKKAIEASGGDQSVRESLEDVELDQLRHNLELAKVRAAENPDDKEAVKMRAGLMKELIQREVEVLGARVERYPRDVKFKFDLAQRFRQLQQFEKAIPLLQQAASDTRYEATALLDLAKCFISVKKNSLARRQLSRLLEKINAHDQKDQFLAAKYWIARICEDAGDTAEAVEHYTDVIGVDYDYKDACARLDKLES